MKYILLRKLGGDARENVAESLRNALGRLGDDLGVLGSLGVVLVVALADGLDFLDPAGLVDLEDFLEVGGNDFELTLVVGEVDVLLEREVADRGLGGLHLAVDTIADPLENAAIIAEAGPHEAAVVALAEPVDEVDLGKLRSVGRGALHLEPVLEVVGDVVAEERKHRHRIAADLTDLIGNDGGGNLGTGGGTHEHAVGPALGLVHQRNRGRTATAEEDRVDRHSRGLLVVETVEAGLVKNGAVLGGSREARVLVSGNVTGLLDLLLGHAGLRTHAVGIVLTNVAGVTLPVDTFLGSLDAHVFPPDVAIGSKNDVREDRTLLAALESVGVGVHRSAGSNAEEAVLGVDRVETAVIAGLDPGDIVADGLKLPALELGLHHREVGLAASGRERGSDVILLLLGARERKDEHVLGHPTLILGHLRSDTKSEALLTEKSVAAVARTERPDFAVFGELGDELVVDVLSAGPSDILLALLERSADGVDAGNELTVGAELLDDGVARAGHDVHVDDDVRGVGKLDAVLGDGVADRAHRERNDVHRTALHAALVALLHERLHDLGIDPMVRGAGVDLLLGTDEGTAFDASDVALVGAGEIALGTLLGVELDELAVLDHHLADINVLFLGTRHDDDLVRRADLVPLVDPGEHLGVREFRRFGHVFYSLISPFGRFQNRLSISISNLPPLA